MAFPKLLQKLFQNSGAGDKLNPEIIPDTAAGKYLPLSGGDMTGDIRLMQSDGTVSSHLHITEGTYAGLDIMVDGDGWEDSGGCLALKNRDSSNETGYFILKAQDNSNASRLEGRPNGDLYWRGAKVLDSDDTVHAARLALANGVNQNLDFFANDSLGGGFFIPGDHHTANEWVALKTAKDTNSGNITATWSSGNNWYRKYSDGFIMQGGATNAAGNRDFWITLPLAFSNASYNLVLGETTSYLSCGSQNTCEYLQKRSNTGFYIDQNDDNSAGTWWVAFGY